MRVRTQRTAINSIRHDIRYQHVHSTGYGRRRGKVQYLDSKKYCKYCSDNLPSDSIPGAS